MKLNPKGILTETPSHVSFKVTLDLDDVIWCYEVNKGLDCPEIFTKSIKLSKPL